MDLFLFAADAGSQIYAPELGDTENLQGFFCLIWIVLQGGVHLLQMLTLVASGRTFFSKCYLLKK